MKKTFLTLAGFFTLFLANAQEIGADKTLDAVIEKYNTFAWVSNIDKIPDDQLFVGDDGVLVFNNKTSRSKIKDAVLYELLSRGYTMKYYEPDMLVNFYVTEKPGKLRTYNGYKLINNGLDTVRTTENAEWTDIKAGTLLIDLIDAKTSEMVWQGYASGLLSADKMNTEVEVMHAVSTVFDKFNFTAMK